MPDEFTPRWIRDIRRFMNIKSQFILSGNVRDIYPFYGGEKVLPFQLKSYLRENLRLDGYEYFICYDPIDGFTLVEGGDPEADKAAAEFFHNTFNMTFKEGRVACSIVKCFEYVKRMVEYRDAFIAVFVDFASRLTINPGSLLVEEKDFFSSFLKLSYSAYPHVTASDRSVKYNSVFWICDKENDFPSWFFVNNPKIRPVVISKPDYSMRLPFISSLAKAVNGYAECDCEQKKTLLAAFADATEGMYNSDVMSIVQLARREDLEIADICEAVRRYNIGVTEDPWAKLDRAKIKNARELLEKRVKGQPQAIIKTLDIIKRSVTGLSGAAHSKQSGKPRGVMFLAGPTGTGKTETAKAITELIFGDERAYIRFDMSEFAAEHADQRLLGAPPGYVGYDAGGELTNAIREKPFSVVLFDEIEKAHPKILDKFLQILEDGRLTDGSGNTVYFSESIIVFTSNLGIHRTDERGQKVYNVTPDMPFADVEARVREEIVKYFKFTLGRPEILNRIGDNIIVFDFIRMDIAAKIFNKVMQNIIERLFERDRIKLAVPKEIYQKIAGLCINDLSNGGRGIGNRIETVFLNTLARELFDLVPSGGAGAAGREIREILVRSFECDGGIFKMELGEGAVSGPEPGR